MSQVTVSVIPPWQAEPSLSEIAERCSMSCSIHSSVTTEWGQDTHVPIPEQPELWTSTSTNVAWG